MVEELRMLPRVLVAFLIGAVIGWERERLQKPAGLRTHILVAMSSGLLMVFGALFVEQRAPEGTEFDPLRIIQGVLTGIGFLGAGAILHDRMTVVGLTTAGTIWVTAVLGLIAGAGFLVLAGAGAILAFVTVSFLGWLEGEPSSRKKRKNSSSAAP